MAKIAFEEVSIGVSNFTINSLKILIIKISNKVYYQSDAVFFC